MESSVSSSSERHAKAPQIPGKTAGVSCLIPVSATILTFNSAKYLSLVLDALRAFDEILILDSGSTDSTLEIARRYPSVRIQRTVFKGFGALHNEAVKLARNDWIFSVDSDEIVSPALLSEIRNLKLRDGTVYAVPFRNYFGNQWIQHCGWHPEHHVRLFNRRRTGFSDAQVHEGIITEGMETVLLCAPILHYSYSEARDFLTKIQLYSDLYALENAGRKQSSLGKAISHSLWCFFKSYILQHGFLGGRVGFMIALANSECVYYKYLKLLEANNNCGKHALNSSVSPGRRSRG